MKCIKWAVLLYLSLTSFIGCNSEGTSDDYLSKGETSIGGGENIDEDGKAEPDLFLPFIVERPLPDICDSLPSIEVPVDHTDPNSAKVTYRYQLAGDVKSDSALVMLPGGPGGGRIRDEIPVFEDARAEKRIVMIDPRGVGCNRDSFSDVPEIHLSTLNHAWDVLSVVGAIDPDNYSIYGVSYGTLVGTVVAHLATTDSEIPSPKVVILEGILGSGNNRIFHKTLEYWKEMLKPGQDAGGLLNQAERQRLNISDDDWATALFKVTYFGKAFVRDSFLSALRLLRESLNPKFSGDASRARALFDAVKGGVEKATGGRRLFGAIGCREIFDLTDGLPVVRDDRLVLSGNNPCGTRGMTQKYDVRNYPIKDTIIYYFHGTDDIATPPKGAALHEGFQREYSLTHYHLVKGGGHNVLNGMACESMLWQNMLRGKNLRSLLDKDGRCL